MDYWAFHFQFTSLTFAQIKDWEISSPWVVSERWGLFSNNPTSRLCTVLWGTAVTFSLYIPTCSWLRKSFHFKLLPLRKFLVSLRIQTERSTSFSPVQRCSQKSSHYIICFILKSWKIHKGMSYSFDNTRKIHRLYCWEIFKHTVHFKTIKFLELKIICFKNR